MRWTGPLTLVVLLLLQWPALPSPPPVRFAGGDGASMGAAVIIEGAATERDGIAAEDLWASQRHPGWRKVGQALLRDEERLYDRIRYEAADGRHEAWFDITAFFGKM